MPTSAPRSISPKASIEAECLRRGRAAVISGCIDVLAGHDADDGLIMALSNECAAAVLAGREGGRKGYWPRVWAARGLLYAWDDSAGAVIIAAADDEHWRVREMAARVIARNRVGDGIGAVLALRDDPVLRVRVAAARAVAALTAVGA